jgi:adenine specific DNA methylase Mod
MNILTQLLEFLKAFSEEKEWRLFTLLMKEPYNVSFFRSCENRLVPYKEVFLNDLQIPIINKVYIGPKNITPVWAIRKFLTQIGFDDVSIERAAATYR